MIGPFTIHYSNKTSLANKAEIIAKTVKSRFA